MASLGLCGVFVEHGGGSCAQRYTFEILVYSDQIRLTCFLFGDFRVFFIDDRWCVFEACQKTTQHDLIEDCDREPDGCKFVDRKPTTSCEVGKSTELTESIAD